MHTSLALALISAASLVSAHPTEHAHHSYISRGLAAKPVRRAEDFINRAHTRELRIAQHQRALEYYQRNVIDERFMDDHRALMEAARAMEQESMRKRAGTSGNSASMSDYFDGNVDILYTAQIGIGTPAQTFNVVPDTGSADLWVVSSTANDPGHTLFDSSKSSTYNASQYGFDDQYGLGEAVGRIVADTVTFVGYTIPNKYFGVATAVDSQFMQQPNDGIIGMCNSVLANQTVYTFFEQMMINKLITNPYFSVYLARGRDTTNQAGTIQGSSICLGCIATPATGSTTGNMVYVPISPARTASPINLFAFYEVTLDSVYFNGQSISGTSTNAMIDTGTTAIYLPTAVASKVMATVNGKLQSDGSYIVPVSSLPSSSVFGLSFGGTVFTINLLDLIDGYTDNTRTNYAMNIYAADTTDPNGALLAIVGDVFIKNVITVYSYSTNGVPSVGFQQISSSGNSTSVNTLGSGGSTSLTRVPGVPTSGTIGRTATGSATSLSSGLVSASSGAGTSSASSTAKSSGRGVSSVNGGAVVGLAMMVIGMLAGVATI